MYLFQELAPLCLHQCAHSSGQPQGFYYCTSSNELASCACTIVRTLLLQSLNSQAVQLRTICVLVWEQHSLTLATIYKPQAVSVRTSTCCQVLLVKSAHATRFALGQNPNMHSAHSTGSYSTTISCPTTPATHMLKHHHRCDC